MNFAVAGNVSNKSTLTVLYKPEITAQPVSQVRIEGTGASFGITVNANPPPSCQWRKNGVNISGAAGAMYSITSVSMSDSGRYSVVITNSQGAVTSDEATLTVSKVLQPPVISVQPQPQTVY